MANINADMVQRRSPKTAVSPQCRTVAYSRHCDMTGIPAVRPYDCKRTNSPKIRYRSYI